MLPERWMMFQVVAGRCRPALDVPAAPPRPDVAWGGAASPAGLDQQASALRRVNVSPLISKPVLTSVVTTDTDSISCKDACPSSLRMRAVDSARFAWFRPCQLS